MKSFTSSLFAALCGGLLVSCKLTSSMTTLYPISGQIAQIEGRQVTKETRNNLQVVAAYEGPFFDYYLFDMEIKNQGTAPLPFYPSDFYGQAAKIFKNGTHSQHFTMLNSVDPRQRMPEIESSIKRAKRRRVANTVLNAGLFIGNLALLTTASNSSNSNNDYWRRAAQYDVTNELIWTKQMIDNQRYRKLINRLSNEKGLLQTDALSETIILPGNSVRGLLLLKSDPKADVISLCYPVSESNSIAFTFEQKTFKIK